MKALENIEKVEERERFKEYEDDDDEEDYLNYPESIQDKLDLSNPGWPNWNQFITKMENLKNQNVYLGSNSRISYNPVWLRRYLINANRRSPQGPHWVPYARPVGPILPPKKPKVLLGLLNTVPKPPPRYDVIYPHGIGGKFLENIFKTYK